MKIEQEHDLGLRGITTGRGINSWHKGPLLLGYQSTHTSKDLQSGNTSSLQIFLYCTSFSAGQLSSRRKMTKWGWKIVGRTQRWSSGWLICHMRNGLTTNRVCLTERNHRHLLVLRDCGRWKVPRQSWSACSNSPGRKESSSTSKKKPHTCYLGALNNHPIPLGKCFGLLAVELWTFPLGLLELAVQFHLGIVTCHKDDDKICSKYESGVRLLAYSVQTMSYNLSPLRCWGILITHIAVTTASSSLQLFLLQLFTLNSPNNPKLS